MKTKQVQILRWITRIMALFMFIIGLLFYFGYGNPLPFVNPEYTWVENVGLILFPLAFIGLAVGWKYEKVGGYMIVGSIVIGFVLGLISQANFPINTLVLLVPGILYLVCGYQKKEVQQGSEKSV